MEVVVLIIISVLLLLFIISIDFLEYLVVKLKRYFRKKPASPCEYCREGYEKVGKMHMDETYKMSVCMEDIIETVKGLKRN